MMARHGPFLYQGLIVEVTAAEIAAAQEVIDLLAESARAQMPPVSFGFGPPRPYWWRDVIRLAWARWRR